jgi:uncharacterized protein YciI
MIDAPVLFVALCRYGPDAHSLRSAAMADHLAYLRRNGERLRFAGPLLAGDGRTATGSLAIVEVAHRAGAEQFVSEEAFHRAGMFDDVEIHRYASTVGGRQVLIAPDASKDLYLCRWTGTADMSSGGGTLPSDTEAASVKVLEAGALVDDDGIGVRGGLVIVETVDSAAARRVAADDVRRRAGAAEDVLVSRWRFGQALGGA